MTTTHAKATARPGLTTRVVRPVSQRDARQSKKPTSSPATAVTHSSGRPVAAALVPLRLAFSAAYRSWARGSSVARIRPEASRRVGRPRGRRAAGGAGRGVFSRGGAGERRGPPGRAPGGGGGPRPPARRDVL